MERLVRAIAAKRVLRARASPRWVLSKKAEQPVKALPARAKE